MEETAKLGLIAAETVEKGLGDFHSGGLAGDEGFASSEDLGRRGGGGGGGRCGNWGSVEAFQGGGGGGSRGAEKAWGLG